MFMDSPHILFYILRDKSTFVKARLSNNVKVRWWYLQKLVLVWDGNFEANDSLFNVPLIISHVLFEVSFYFFIFSSLTNYISC